MIPKTARRNVHRAAAASFFALSCTVCAQAEPDNGLHATSSVERHWTSNALDSDQAIPDWYTLIRGSQEQQWGGDEANVKLGAEFQATRYDTVKIENDRALALSVQAFRQLRPGLELRGSLSYRTFSDGDDLSLGPFVIGTRTPKHIFGATGQIGIDLGNSTTLIIDAAGSHEKIGATHFENDLIQPFKLDPDLNRAQLGARLTRTLGQFAVGASGSALLVSVEKLGDPPVALSLTQYTLRGEIGYTAEDGSTVGLAIGGELLRGAYDSYSQLRPTWQASFAKKLPQGFELRGTYFGRYETVDSDDPLASWLQRAELEISLALRENLALASGIFAENKENLLFENVERKRGVYGELTYNTTPTTAIVLRVDYSKLFKTVIEERQSTVDAFIGVRARI
jgi:hypothetical protein